MNNNLSNFFAQAPGLADSFNQIFNSPQAMEAAPTPGPLPAPRDIHCVGDDDADNFI